jgi:sugar/nucleoside kinase (ribokinase family)
MNAAIVLASLGLSTRIGGPRFGWETEACLRRYAERYDIDVSSVTTDRGYPGVRDIVIVYDRHRTVFGRFGHYFEDPVRRWDEADPEGIAEAAVVSIDPFFVGSSERAATLATTAGKPYVTIDCPFDDVLHQRAAATVISREYRRGRYPEIDEETLFAKYAAARGLTIFTAGLDPVRYGGDGRVPGRFKPFRVDAVSTLGAGDVFRAGVVYGLFRKLGDPQIVAFASALAAVACGRMPIADHPPDLEAVQALIRSREDY